MIDRLMPGALSEAQTTVLRTFTETSAFQLLIGESQRLNEEGQNNAGVFVMPDHTLRGFIQVMLRIGSEHKIPQIYQGNVTGEDDLQFVKEIGLLVGSRPNQGNSLLVGPTLDQNWIRTDLRGRRYLTAHPEYPKYKRLDDKDSLAFGMRVASLVPDHKFGVNVIEISR